MSAEERLSNGDAQSAAPGRRAPREWLEWPAASVSLLALAGWTTRLTWPWLAIAAAAGLLWLLVTPSRPRGAKLLAAAILALAIGTAAGFQYRLAAVAGEWSTLERRIEEAAATALNRDLDDLVAHGEAAIDGVERALGGIAPAAAGAPLFARLEQLRGRSGVSALALYDAQGVALAWGGEHRGTLPTSVRRGERAYSFHQGPLFGYLYFVRQLPGGQTAVAAMLLDSNVPVGEGVVPFAERFERRHGLRPRFTLPERARGETVWDWSTDRPILSVSFLELTQQHWWERIAERGRRTVAALWLLALVMVTVRSYRRRSWSPGAPVLLATAGLLLLPLGEIVEADTLFSPLLFVLPGPGDVTLGMVLILLAGASVWLLTRIPTEPGRLRLPWLLSVAIAALVFPAGLLLIQRSAAGGLLVASPAGGVPLQLAATLLLAIPIYLLLSTLEPVARPRRAALLGLGLLVSAAMGAAVVLAWHPRHGVPIWVFAAWAVPFALAASAYMPTHPQRRGMLRWLLAGWLSASAALPHLWTLQNASELALAERELARLGTETDPYLSFLLRQFADRVRFFAADGEDGVNLLYHSWVASGLAREGYEARLTIWRENQVETELRLSALPDLPEAVALAVAATASSTEPVVERYTGVEGLHYLLLVPMEGERVISVAVPPRHQIGRATALARFLQPHGETQPRPAQETLHLVPISTEEAEEVEAGLLDLGTLGVEWVRIDNGWRSEARAPFPSGWMHAHLIVRSTPFPLLGVRGLLLMTLLLTLSAVLWAVGRLLCGEMPVIAPLRREWLRSFRGRLTIVLFVFFLAPMAVFGAVAYSAVAREVVRSAAALAQRSLEQAAREVSRSTLAEAGALVGADLLLFRQGTLVAAAAPEVLDLGLFQTWLPPEVFLRFARGEELEEREERRLAGSEYLIAYRRLDPAVVLAAPVPLASEEITRRQREFAHIALLMILLGAAFSVILSLLAGRALTRPLDQLGRAAATVGGGNLRVRLPEDRRDEFGGVYAAFNRMVRRIYRARAALVRETRRTETIVAEAATGVLALDRDRRVELVNPRASEILAGALNVGDVVPRTGPLLTALADAIDDFWGSGAAEAGLELEVDGRIVRVRLRRLRAPQGQGGAVLALEDVTSEVRTARVLAWGEMARQVAHEIKNPLTPIKLSVQHLRRAHRDGRADFSQILERNVEAVLREIDRLGEIARAFSRFGTPEEQAEPPERVDLLRAVEDVLVLYRGAEDGLTYQMEVEPDSPECVVARLGELKEVLVNLLENARQALNGTGTIRISIAAAPPDHVALEVSDTGQGISAELLGRIFEPHFSTRTSGTGLGLAIVRRLVESWGGSISAESEPGVGTSMRLLLRVAENDARS